MALILSKNKQVTLAVEDTPGTRVEPTSSDMTIRYNIADMPSADTAIERLGELADGTMRKGKLTSRERALTFPTMSDYFLWSGDVAVAPQSWAVAECGGWRIDTSETNPKLVWDGTPGDKTLSGDYKNFAADKTGFIRKARGLSGNFAIKCDQSNGPLYFELTNLAGADLGEADAAPDDFFEISGEDTSSPEKMGSYVFSWGGQTYCVESFEINPNTEVSMATCNNTEGIERNFTGDMDMMFTATIRRLLPSTDDLVGDAFADAEFATATITGGNLDIAMNNLQFTEMPSLEDTNNNVAFSISASILGSVEVTQVA